MKSLETDKCAPKGSVLGYAPPEVRHLGAFKTIECFTRSYDGDRRISDVVEGCLLHVLHRYGGCGRPSWRISAISAVGALVPPVIASGPMRRQTLSCFQYYS